MMLRRSPFKPKAQPPSRARVKQWTGPAPTPRKTVVAMLVAPRRIVPDPKENPLQHQGYMAAVRRLACLRCGTLALPRDFCHSDSGGKGMGLKTDCRLGWPGCRPCHNYVGASGRMGKEGRREFETFAGAVTRREVIAAGMWPARLPRWE